MDKGLNTRIVVELMTYQEVKAEVENIELMIEEVEKDCDMTRAIRYCEKVQTSCTNNFQTPSNIIENLLVKKDELKRKIRKIDNAMTILNETEKKALSMKYFKSLPYSHLEVFFERSNRQVKRVIKRALNKIEPLM